jgi:hypothetical protein
MRIAVVAAHYPDVGWAPVVEPFSAGFLTAGEKIRLADINEVGGSLAVRSGIYRNRLLTQIGALSELLFLGSS